MNQKDFIKNYNFKFKKNFGQNFILDDNVLNKIVDSADIDNSTLVIEIGCGAGALTRKISSKTNKVLGYEIDTSLKPILDTISNVNIIYDDFLKRDVLLDIKDYQYDKLFVVANLPYYITTPIISKIIDDKIDVDRMIIMVQKEVGDRFLAKPRTKEYNSLSIFINYYFDVYKLFLVSRNVFIPKPNVDSIVLKLDKKEIINKPKDETVFFKLIRDSFVQKRKTLRNNLKNYDFDKVLEVLKKYGYSDNVRAEEIPASVFVDISNNI